MNGAKRRYMCVRACLRARVCICVRTYTYTRSIFIKSRTNTTVFHCRELDVRQCISYNHNLFVRFQAMHVAL